MNNKKPSKIATTITTILIFFVVLFWTFGSFMGILSTCQEKEKASAASQYITAELPHYTYYEGNMLNMVSAPTSPLYIRFTTETAARATVSFYTWKLGEISESTAMNTQNSSVRITISVYRDDTSLSAFSNRFIFISSGQITNIPDSFIVTVDSNRIRYSFYYGDTELFYILYNYGDTLHRPYLPADFSQTFPFDYSYGYVNSDIVTKAAYDRGFYDGSQEGYAEGYDEAARLFGSTDTSFGALFLAIAEVPYNIISSMFSFELFGYDMSQFVFSLITVIVIICVVRWFI